jgi:hypothetical protein
MGNGWELTQIRYLLLIPPWNKDVHRVGERGNGTLSSLQRIETTVIQVRIKSNIIGNSWELT